MATVASIRIVKETDYRGALRQWSNRYHFTGGIPANTAAWTTLANDVVAKEHVALHNETTIVQAVGYAPGSDVPVFELSYNTGGALNFAAGSAPQTLEVAALVRWATPAKSVKNHPIYLFSYFHNTASGSATATKENLDPNHLQALQTYANFWMAGFGDGQFTLKRSSPNGATSNDAQVHEYVTHRDFP